MKVYNAPVSKLLEYKKIESHANWDNYLELGFTEEHIPQLLEMINDSNLAYADDKTLKFYAPIHAWRTLAQLRSEKAIKPILNMLLDDPEDDWLASDIPAIYGYIGAAALPPLVKVIKSEKYSTYLRGHLCETVSEIGLKNPEVKDKCSNILKQVLLNFRWNDPILNGFAVASLLCLRVAEEHIELIRRAFAECQVDESNVGSLQDIEKELGIFEESAEHKHEHVHVHDGSCCDHDHDHHHHHHHHHHHDHQEKSKIGRNDPCHCGSGKKYKKCCMNS